MNSTATTSCFNSTSIEDDIIIDWLLAYPNPTNSDVNIEFESSKTQNIKIEVYNTFGQKIYNKQINSFSGHFKEKIDFSGFCEGIYILNIIYNNGQLHTKRISYIK